MNILCKNMPCRGFIDKLSNSKHFVLLKHLACPCLLYVVEESGFSAHIPQSQYVILAFAKHILQAYSLRTFFRL